MFIDYVALMLINMVAGLFILGCYVYKGLDDKDQKRWAPAFCMSGLIALLSGFHMIWHWPLPGSYNSAYGETSVLLGVLFLTAGIAIAKGWDLTIISIYAFFSGIVPIIIGAQIIHLGLTKFPTISGIGFILSGLGGISTPLVLYFRSNRTLRLIVAIILLLAALIWAQIGYIEYWGHLADFAKYLPQSMIK